MKKILILIVCAITLCATGMAQERPTRAEIEKAIIQSLPPDERARLEVYRVSPEGRARQAAYRKISKATRVEYSALWNAGLKEQAVKRHAAAVVAAKVGSQTCSTNDGLGCYEDAEDFAEGLAPTGSGCYWSIVGFYGALRCGNCSEYFHVAWHRSASCEQN